MHYLATYVKKDMILGGNISLFSVFKFVQPRGQQGEGMCTENASNGHYTAVGDEAPH